jgi:hypothetical protein
VQSLPIIINVVSLNSAHGDVLIAQITFIRWVPIIVVFVCKLIHEIKNPTNNETWEAV